MNRGGDREGSGAHRVPAAENCHYRLHFKIQFVLVRVVNVVIKSLFFSN